MKEEKIISITRLCSFDSDYERRAAAGRENNIVMVSCGRNAVQKR
jgi:hypothetical protein